MATLAELRAGLRDVIEAGGIDGLTVLDRRPGSVPVLPAVWVQPSTATYAVPVERRGLDVYDLSVIVVVSMADVDVAQEQLDELLTKTGPRSIRALIKASPNLGLDPGTTAWVDRLTYGADAFAGMEQDVLGAILHVLAHTDG